jgi:glycerophosphoryl diester phosphodiesterase
VKVSLLLRQLISYWRPILVVHVVFTLLGITLLAPLFGLLLQVALALSGSVAVADQDIAMLLLSPLGMAGAVIMVGLLLAIAGLELGALQVIAQAAMHSVRVKPLQAVLFALRHAAVLFGLTLGLTLRVLVYLVPAVLALAALKWYFLNDYDINYYLSQTPAEFYVALGLGIVVLLLLTWFLGRRLLGWSLVLPLVLFAGVSPRAAFARSEQLTAGHRPELLRALLGWLLLALLLALVPIIFLKLTATAVVSVDYGYLTPLLLLLGFVALGWMLLNFLVTALNMAGFTLVVADLYRRVGDGVSDKVIVRELLAAERAGGYDWKLSRVILAVLLVTVLAGFIGVWLLRGVKLDDEVLVVAHRGAAGAAPENTLASIRRAIADGADWVEIDVQETRDGQVVVVHDSDFMKLSGNPLKVWDGDLAEIGQIDVGSWFGEEFADQRVPTLQQVLEEIRGRSRLVIELKYYGHDQQLEQRVVDLVENAGMAEDVVIMSLKLAGVEKIQALRPDWTTGLLAATAIGKLSRVDVDFLAVNQNMANRGFIRRAHATGKRVFVWTINDALSLSRWMSMGVDGVITDEPALAKRVLAERAELRPAERLLLSAAFFFGKPDVAAKYRDESP